MKSVDNAINSGNMKRASSLSIGITNNTTASALKGHSPLLPAVLALLSCTPPPLCTRDCCFHCFATNSQQCSESERSENYHIYQSKRAIKRMGINFRGQFHALEIDKIVGLPISHSHHPYRPNNIASSPNQPSSRSATHQYPEQVLRIASWWGGQRCNSGQSSSQFLLFWSSDHSLTWIPTRMFKTLDCRMKRLVRYWCLQ